MEKIKIKFLQMFKKTQFSRGHSRAFPFISIQVQEQTKEPSRNPFLKKKPAVISEPSLLRTVQQIPGVGKVKAPLLLQKFPSIQQLSNASIQELEPVVGPAVAQHIHAFFTQPRWQASQGIYCTFSFTPQITGSCIHLIFKRYQRFPLTTTSERWGETWIKPASCPTLLSGFRHLTYWVSDGTALILLARRRLAGIFVRESVYFGTLRFSKKPAWVAFNVCPWPMSIRERSY